MKASSQAAHMRLFAINLAFAMLYVAVAAVVSAGADVSAQTTTRKGKLVRRVVTEATTTNADTTEAAEVVLRHDVDSVLIGERLSLRGYDKPLRSLRESIFVTNRFDSPISGFAIDVEYTDGRGEMLHRRMISVKCDVPPGETRQLYVPAWDRHYTYYYKSTRIRKHAPDAVPYDVTIRPVSVTLRY